MEYTLTKDNYDKPIPENVTILYYVGLSKLPVH